MGIVKHRTLGNKFNRMPSVSENDADWVTRRCAKRKISFRRMTNVKTKIPRMKLGMISLKT